MQQTLTDKTIAIPETRLLDVFARLLEKRGARVIRCPLIGIHTTPDTDQVQDWVKRCNADELDDLILLTGEGLRRIIGIIDETELKPLFIAQLGQLRKITRGPKPVRALQELGLKTDLMAATPTTAGVIQTLSEHDLQGRTVGVQLYGSDPNQPLMDFLAAAGATAAPVAPYVYANEAEDEQVLGLINDIIAGRVDALAITSSPQVRRLLQVARKFALETAFRAACADLLIAAVGPVARDALLKADLHCDVMPQDSYFMKPMVKALEQHFKAQR